MTAIRAFAVRAVAVAAVTTAVTAPSADAGDPAAPLDEIRTFLRGAEVRYPGSPGNLSTEGRVDAFFSRTNLPHGEIRFEAPVFVPGETRITPEGLTPVRIIPMHPTLFRPGNFAGKDFHARLVYLGRGTTEDLDSAKGIALKDAVALMDFDCGDSWRRLLRFGVKGFIFVGGPDYCGWEARRKIYATEVRVPRFLAEGDDGKRLKEAATVTPAGIDCRIQAEPSRWRNEFLRDLWAFIPGTHPDLQKDVCVIVAPMDSNCVAPELAVGAQNAANLSLLLRLYDEFSKQPPARSVLLVAVNAHTQNYRGERMLAWHLLAPHGDVSAVRGILAADIRREEAVERTYRGLRLSPIAEADTDFVSLRTMTDESTGTSILAKEPIVALARRSLNRVKAQRAALLHSTLSPRERALREEELDKSYSLHVDVLTLFNRVGVRTRVSDLNREQMDILKDYVETILRHYGKLLELDRRDLAVDTANDAVRETLAGRRVAFVLSLDLTWQNGRVGLSAFDRGIRNPVWQHAFGAATVRIARALREKKNLPEDPFIDTMTNVGGLPEYYFFPSHDSCNPVFHRTARTPAFSLRNVYADSGRAFTPSDTFDRLDAGSVATLMSYLPSLLRGILDDRDAVSPSVLARPDPLPGSYTIRLETFEFDEFSPSVMPPVPVPGCAMGILHSVDAPLNEPFFEGDVVGFHFGLADARAKRFFYAIDQDPLSNPGARASSAFHYDDDFVNADRAIDAGDVHSRIDSDIGRYPVRTLTMFPCREFPVYDREDPSAIAAQPISADTVIVVDAARNGVPRKYGISGMSSLSGKALPSLPGPASVYAHEKDVIKLLFGGKRTARGRRPVLNATDSAPEGIGFDDAESLGTDVFAMSAKDTGILCRFRMSRMPGVHSELTSDFLERGSNALERAAASARENDHTGYVQAVHAALGAQTKAYDWVSAITNDMLKAIVFYMFLLLPFCFFVQKLLFKFTRIEHEMLAFAGLFLSSFFIFRLIHPAFQAAKAPQVIPIAFVMLLLSLFVIYILQTRFEGEMRLLFRRHRTMDAAAIGYSTVGQNAVLVGVNNMKRRRVRTALTTATIVLVTFCMLAFSSVSQKLNPTIVPISKNAPYTGVFYAWPGNLRMDEATVDAMRTLLHGLGETNVRRWILPPRQGWGSGMLRLHAGTDDGRKMDVDAVLGLQSSEDGFMARMPLRGGRFFSSDDAMEVVLPMSAAGVFNIDALNPAGNSLLFQGHRFDVVGVVDDELLRATRDLNDRPILPIKTTRRQEKGEVKAEVAAEESLTDDSGVFFAETSALLLLPAGSAKRLGAEPYSISVRLKDGTPIWPVVDRLLTATGAKFFVGSRSPVRFGTAEDLKASAAGVYYLGSGYKTRIGGLARLVIPLLIAMTIILNTMLGSVHERRQEIAVYNAIGLNPTHIAVFFLSEALVYSVIGAVGGYLAGQAAAVAITALGLLRGINLNFSSLAVVYVIAFTILVVLLSTIYPAIIATRTAIPSGKRRWAMPATDGNRMTVVFPFIYEPGLVGAIMAYLADYLGQFSEASVGELVAKRLRCSRERDEDGRDVYSIAYDIALAPYDLGVTQTVAFRASHDQVMRSHRIIMTIDRKSGQDASWMTTNRPFMERLRTYMMHWRNLDAAQHERYRETAEGLFGGHA